jgi:tetratricopeptide (TPR) repeat protein
MIDFKDIESFKKSIETIYSTISSVNDIEKQFIDFETKIKETNPININEYRLNYYRTVIEKIIDTIDIISLNKLANHIIITTNEYKDDQHKYNLVMDTNILCGIRLYSEKEIIGSQIYFQNAIIYGENHLDYSKKEYYDSLNCAYSWAGVIYFNQNNKIEAYNCFQKAIDHYNEVKDDPNYNVKEKDIIQICTQYVAGLQKESINN